MFILIKVLQLTRKLVQNSKVGFMHNESRTLGFAGRGIIPIFVTGWMAVGQKLIRRDLRLKDPIVSLQNRIELYPTLIFIPGYESCDSSPLWYHNPFQHEIIITFIITLSWNEV